MKLFTVRYNIPYESNDIIGIFTTLEKARKFIEYQSSTIMPYDCEAKKRKDMEIHEVSADSMDEIDTFAEAVE